MLNKELKSLDSFSCVFMHNLGEFGPSFPKPLQYLSTWETGITQPTEALDTKVKSHLMWNKKLKPLDYFSCVPHVIWGIRAQFPKIKIWMHVKCDVENFVLIFLCVPIFML